MNILRSFYPSNCPAQSTSNAASLVSSVDPEFRNMDFGSSPPSPIDPHFTTQLAATLSFTKADASVSPSRGFSSERSVHELETKVTNDHVEAFLEGNTYMGFTVNMQHDNFSSNGGDSEIDDSTNGLSGEVAAHPISHSSAGDSPSAQIRNEFHFPSLPAEVTATSPQEQPHQEGLDGNVHMATSWEDMIADTEILPQCHGEMPSTADSVVEDGEISYNENGAMDLTSADIDEIFGLSFTNNPEDASEHAEAAAEENLTMNEATSNDTTQDDQICDEAELKDETMHEIELQDNVPAEGKFFEPGEMADAVKPDHEIPVEAQVKEETMAKSEVEEHEVRANGTLLDYSQMAAAVKPDQQMSVKVEAKEETMHENDVEKHEVHGNEKSLEYSQMAAPVKPDHQMSVEAEAKDDTMHEKSVADMTGLETAKTPEGLKIDQQMCLEAEAKDEIRHEQALKKQEAHADETFLESHGKPERVKLDHQKSVEGGAKDESGHEKEPEKHGDATPLESDEMPEGVKLDHTMSVEAEAKDESTHGKEPEKHKVHAGDSLIQHNETPEEAKLDHQMSDAIDLQDEDVREEGLEDKLEKAADTLSEDDGTVNGPSPEEPRSDAVEPTDKIAYDDVPVDETIQRDVEDDTDLEIEYTPQGFRWARGASGEAALVPPTLSLPKAKTGTTCSSQTGTAKATRGSDTTREDESPHCTNKEVSHEAREETALLMRKRKVSTGQAQDPDVASDEKRGGSTNEDLSNEAQEPTTLPMKKRKVTTGQAQSPNSTRDGKRQGSTTEIVSIEARKPTPPPSTKEKVSTPQAQQDNGAQLPSRPESEVKEGQKLPTNHPLDVGLKESDSAHQPANPQTRDKEVDTMPAVSDQAQLVAPSSQEQVVPRQTTPPTNAPPSPPGPPPEQPAPRLNWVLDTEIYGPDINLFIGDIAAAIRILRDKNMKLKGDLTRAKHKLKDHDTQLKARDGEIAELKKTMEGRINKVNDRHNKMVDRFLALEETVKEKVEKPQEEAPRGIGKGGRGSGRGKRRGGRKW